MSKDSPENGKPDARYIPGIYNYCDRWCERCRYTARCLSFASRELHLKQTGEDPMEEIDLMDRLYESFESTLDLLEEMLPANLSDTVGRAVDPDEQAGTLAARRRAVSQTKVCLLANDYAERVETWFVNQEEAFDHKQEELVLKSETGVYDEDRFDRDAEHILDAVDVIRWYQYQIYHKLMRAQAARELGAELGPLADQDANGSAKVALLDMDASIDAWCVMREEFPDRTDDILDVLVLLSRLREQVEREFPAARDFCRPGFDTETEEENPWT